MTMPVPSSPPPSESRPVMEKVIGSYAVLLNRPGWLDPARLEVQTGVWSRLLEDHLPVPVLADFEHAIVGLLETTSPMDVLPHAIVAEAQELAASRRERAQRAIRLWRSYPDQLLGHIAGAYIRHVEAEDLGAAVQLVSAARRQVREDVRDSGLLSGQELIEFYAALGRAYDALTGS